MITNPGSPSSTRPTAIHPTWDWPQFWAFANTQLRAAGYRTSTCRLYRQACGELRRIAGQGLTTSLRTPKCPRHLPRTAASPGEAPISARTSPLRRVSALIASALGKRPPQRPPG